MVDTNLNHKKLVQIMSSGSLRPRYYDTDNRAQRIMFLANDGVNFTDPFPELVGYYKANSSEFLQKLKCILCTDETQIPCRNMIFHTLANILHHGGLNNIQKQHLREAVFDFIKSDEEFFGFIERFSRLNKERTTKFSKSVRNLIKMYYTKKTAEQLADSYMKRRSYKKWSHKDLIKLVHLEKKDPAYMAVVNYILFNGARNAAGIKSEAIKIIASNRGNIPILTQNLLTLLTPLNNSKGENFTEKLDEHEVVRIHNIFHRMEEIQQLRNPKCGTVKATDLIRNTKATIHQVASHLWRDESVWLKALPNMSVQEILQVLTRLAREKILNPRSQVLQDIMAFISDPEVIRKSKIHPVEVFVRMQNFVKGGKPRDPNLIQHLRKNESLTAAHIRRLKVRKPPSNCEALIKQLDLCMRMACHNIQPTNKRYFITIDVSKRNCISPCISNRILTSVEVAVGYAMILMLVEKEVTVNIYVNNRIRTLKLEKDATFAANANKAIWNKEDEVVYYAPIDWAIENHKEVDVFINFVNNDHLVGGDGVVKLNSYKQLMKLPETKLVNFCVNAYKPDTNTQNEPYYMEVFGFGVDAFKAVDNFCRDLK